MTKRRGRWGLYRDWFRVVKLDTPGDTHKRNGRHTANRGLARSIVDRPRQGEEWCKSTLDSRRSARPLSRLKVLNPVQSSR